MDDLEHVEQWVVLAREGEYQVGEQRFAITKETLVQMAANFARSLPVFLSSDALGPPDMNPPMPSSRCEMVAAEVRESSRGHYLAAKISSPFISFAFVENGRNRKTGESVGACLAAVYFATEKLSPIERATDPATSESASPEQTLPHSR
jgi:hypothetical protein